MATRQRSPTNRDREGADGGHVGRVADAATGPGLFAAPGRHAVAPLAVGKKRWRPPALRLLVPRAGVGWTASYIQSQTALAAVDRFRWRRPPYCGYRDLQRSLSRSYTAAQRWPKAGSAAQGVAATSVCRRR
jgi:hypothetical protein